MFKFTLSIVFLVPLLSLSQTPCSSGMAGSFPCDGYDLQSHLTLSSLSASSGNDSWGWTDPLDGTEYALMGLNNGIAFIDISDPVNPIYLGKLPTHSDPSLWRDVKVYNNYAFVVSEASSHGMQVFDLTRLRNVASPPETFTEDAYYGGFGHCHNIAINEDTGYAYAIGTSTFGGGPHFIDISDPLNPVAAGGYSGSNYTHDAQIITYNGPDTDYTGHEIFFGSNEDRVVIVDVTNKANPQLIKTINYANVSYTHQCWLTDDRNYLLVGDELDESNFGFNTRTLVFDVSDLDTAAWDFDYFANIPSIDHNGYVVGDKYYLASYTGGIRVLDISDIANQNISEVGFFDTYPSNNSANFDGVWNVYPFFGSGNIVISDLDDGFFVVKESLVDNIHPVAVCQSYTASLDANGQAIIAGSDVDGGSSDNSGFFTLSVSPNTFNCSDIGGPITVTLTVTDPSGNTDTCTTEVTIVDDMGPTFSCYSNETVAYDTGNPYYTLPNYVLNNDVTATDNCTSNLTITQDPVAGTQLTVGTYTISFEATDDEGNTSTCSFELTVLEELGVGDYTLEKGLVIYPNPASNQVNILSKFEKINHIELYDISGKRLLDLDQLDFSNYTINTSALSKGVYFVKLNQQLSKKIIIN